MIKIIIIFTSILNISCLGAYNAYCVPIYLEMNVIELNEKGVSDYKTKVGITQTNEYYQFTIKGISTRYTIKNRKGQFGEYDKLYIVEDEHKKKYSIMFKNANGHLIYVIRNLEGNYPCYIIKY